MSPTVLVTGATGKTGRELSRVLAARSGVDVRAGVRISGAAEDAGATRVRFDWTDETTWAAALAGADAVYLVKPKLPDVAERVGRLLTAADAAGAARVVLLSEIAAELQDEATPERRVELVVESGPLAWTILRPNWFMQDMVDSQFWLGAIRDHRRIALSTAGRPISFIDTRDIADVAAEALVVGRHSGQAYTLTGGEAVTVVELAARLSRRRRPRRAGRPDARRGLHRRTRIRVGHAARLSDGSHT